jgi:hypothetical protein
MRIAVAVCVLAAWLAAPSHAEDAQAESPKRAVILKLMELTQAAQMGKQVTDALLGQIQPMFSEVPAKVWDELIASFTPGEMQELVIPIYERNFTLEELQALVAFYESPLGKTLLSKMPAVVQESMSVGNQWGMQKAEELFRKLKERGFEPAQA